MNKIKINSDAIVWDLESKAPDVFKHVSANMPWVKEQFSALSKELPIADSCTPFKNDQSFRPFQHNRAFYLMGPQADVISIKGTEIFTKDLYEAMQRARYHRISATSMTLTEHFPIVEQKVPLALHSREAFEEAEAGAAIQSAYLRRYKTLARMPLPLYVFRWPEQEAKAFADKLLPMLSPYAREIAERVIGHGLASLAYYYPGTPNRVRDLTVQLSGIKTGDGWAKRKGEMQSLPNANVTIQRWIQLAVQILGLGYFPVTMSHLFIGQCLQPQNAVLDGGYVDCDSIQPISNMKDEKEFFEHFLTTVGWIGYSIQEYLIGMGTFTPYLWHILLEANKTNFLSNFIAARTWTDIRRAVEVEQKNGVKFDPRLERLFKAENIFDELGLVLESIYPGTEWAHRGSWM